MSWIRDTFQYGQVQQTQQAQQTQQTQQTPAPARKKGGQDRQVDIDLAFMTMTHEPASADDIAKFRSLIFADDGDVNFSWGDAPVVVYAAANGHLAYLKTLHELGADMHAKDDKGDTALHKAILSKHTDCTLFLLNDAGCDPETRNRQGRSAAWYGKFSDSPDIVDLFREKTPAEIAQKIDALAHGGMEHARESAPMPEIKKTPFPVPKKESPAP